MYFDGYILFAADIEKLTFIPPILTLYQTTKILDLSKLKSFADDKINLIKKKKKKINLPWEGQKTLWEKGENVGNQHFLLFPQCFQKATFSGLLKVGIVWQRVK